MGITLYTSRVVLKELGVSDYGVYNLVGGIVAMIGFFNGAMSSVTQRYLAHDIGKGNFQQLKKTFSTTLTIHFGIAILGLILAETLGLWYVNNKMVFPIERLYAVNVVYQFSILTFLLSIIQVPYNALIIAREHMKVYAYISILEAVLKLVIVFMLIVFGSDKLITYAILTFIISLIIRIIYQLYCKYKFNESVYKFEYDRLYFRELLGYSSWTLIGAISLVSKNQGMNLILNLFYGTFINTSYSISLQVQSAIQLFVSNFQSALNPQIIKNYAANEIENSKKLMFLGAKFSTMIMLILIIPIYFNVDFLIKLWLNEVPSKSIVFIKLSLIVILIDSLSGPIMTGVLATGKIKMYNIIIGGINILSLPISYYLLNLGYDSYIIFYVLIFFSVVSLFLRLLIVKKEFNFKVKDFFFKVVLRLLLIIISVVLLERAVVLLIDFDPIINFVFLFIVTSFLTVAIGFDKNERNKVINMIKSKL